MKLTRLLLIFVVVLGLFAPVAMSARPVAAQAPVVYSYLPTGYVSDGKMMVIASGAAYKTLSLEPIRMLIVTDAPVLEFGVFDADIGGRWDSYGSGPRGRIAYRLYADPTASGTPTGSPIASYFSDDAGALDNTWYSIVRPQHPDAADGSQFKYLLTVAQLDPNAVSIADFKIRAVGTLAVAAGVTFGFEGALTGALDIVFPNYPSTSVTTYDGLWSFRFFVPVRAPLDEVSLWDGDLDYGDGVTVFDTDDSDTPPSIPGFSASPHAVPEGAQGVGSPPENNPFTPVARGNPVTYELVGPDGAHYLNANPSGNQEWEHFIVRTTTHPETCSAGGNADYCVASLSPGIWTVNVFGMDASNVNYYHFDYGVLPGSSSAGLNGYVYEDLDRDGVFETNEVGLEGVLVTLSGFDLAGVAVNLSTHTVAGGYYEFVPLPAGTYTVVETDPAGYFSVSVTPGSTGGTRSADFNTLSGIPLAANQLSANNNFGDLRGGEFCIWDPTNPKNSGTGEWWITKYTKNSTVFDAVTIRTTLNRAFEDNAYGTNSKITGWPGGGRKFKQIWTSDCLEMKLYNGNGQSVMQFAIDLLAENASAPSGYKTAGFAAKDGYWKSGNKAYVLGYETSISWNLNNTGWRDFNNSPKVDANYQCVPGNPCPANWIWDCWYEVTIDLRAFGSSGFGRVQIPFLHASPSKTGVEQPPMQACPE